MTSDSDLLRQYLHRRDEGAFAELVRRHLNLVYAATLRLVNGDTALAEDATQAAFAQLALKAGRLAGHATLAGWLHTTARYHALRGIRTEQRRRAREQEASAMNDITDTAALDAAWTQLRPLLDEALGRLRDGERDAVLLRYFEEKSYREVGGILGVSERAAQMRVERALEKLRAQFSRRGVATTAALLVTALGAHGSPAAPAGLAAAVVEKSLAQSLAVNVAAFSTRKLLLAAGGVLVAMLFFIVLQQTKIPAATNAAPSPAKSLPVVQTQPTSTSTPMTTSAIINRGTLVAAIVAVAPLATAQNNPPLPPPVPASMLAPNAVAAEAATPTTIAAGNIDPLVLANNRFALDLFRQFGPKPNENAFFSPYSISTALAMTWTGARGDTAAQMAKVLHFSELAAGEVPADFAALQQAVAKAQTLSGSQLSIANSLWAEQNPEHPFLPGFLDGALANFSAPVTPVDFIHHAAEAAAQINAWVEQKTNDKIKNLVHPGDVGFATRLALVNAIYFKGKWQYPFRPERNTSSEFHPVDGPAIPAVLMNQGIFTGYADITDAPVPCQILSLHYSELPRSIPVGQKGVSFIAILPHSAGDLEALSKSLTAEQLAGWLDRMRSGIVLVAFPKFKLEERYQLADLLQAMGMKNAFVNPGSQPSRDVADFSGMDGARDLFISQVIHQTFVNVDESGTEAAAATAVFMAGGAGPSAPPPEFRADHPFLFLIRDDASGSILFLGQLANPDPLHEDIPPPSARGTRAFTPRGTGRGVARGTAARGPAIRGATATSLAPSPAAPPPPPVPSASQP